MPKLLKRHYDDIEHEDVWLKCLCVGCQKKMKGKILVEDPYVIMVKNWEEEGK